MLLTAEQPVQWNDETVERLETRKAVYQLLADFLGEMPTLDVIMSWRNHQGLQEMSCASEGAKQLRLLLENLSINELYAVFSSLRDEYMRLFGSSGQLPVTPCETMYRASEQMLPKSYAQVVRQTYAEFSLYFKKMNGEPDDHIAIELEFMAVLIEKMMNSVMTEERFDRYMNGQREFVLHHLKRWAPRFGDDLKQHAEHPVYQAIGLLLKEFISKEVTWAEKTKTA
ncbi:molecular chaperone TorD family protein [Paenibacillus profundus]|uniref:Molecular chaperone TorD family protein n=1 Tax=Paenibacillus profundus TaxID=1173085 RepID=A0ABS8YB55_9BACL|nr:MULTISPECIES: molecular chaperone TorD family protein [Paenibacillus]MCE5169211.1 molecular chaperone TorD family protein [Paenibacillus profundus]MCM3338642.1 molecular chaperone TorD family protein [Paenibacillus sp. MER TA 81-3]